jgi:hypothetical protein
MSRKVNVLDLIEKGEVLAAHVTGDVLKLQKVGARDEILKLVSLVAEVEKPEFKENAGEKEISEDTKKGIFGKKK